MEHPESTSPIRYPDWFADWKSRIQSAQIKAALQVNREVLLLYWELGHDIAEKQKSATWGDGLIPRFARDLKAAFPHLKGFSRTNLFYVRKWYLILSSGVLNCPTTCGTIRRQTKSTCLAERSTISKKC